MAEKVIADLNQTGNFAINVDQHFFNVGEGVRSTLIALEGRLVVDGLKEFSKSCDKEREVYNETLWLSKTCAGRMNSTIGDFLEIAYDANFFFEKSEPVAEKTNEIEAKIQEATEGASKATTVSATLEVLSEKVEKFKQPWSTYLKKVETKQSELIEKVKKLREQIRVLQDEIDTERPKRRRTPMNSARARLVQLRKSSKSDKDIRETLVKIDDLTAEAERLNGEARHFSFIINSVAGSVSAEIDDTASFLKKLIETHKSAFNGWQLFSDDMKKLLPKSVVEDVEALRTKIDGFSPNYRKLCDALKQYETQLGRA